MRINGRERRAPQSFDSARVVLALRPDDVEMLLDHYHKTFTKRDDAEVTRLALAYADHTRICGLIALRLQAMANVWQPVFAQVTDDFPITHCDNDRVPDDELQCRLDTAVRAIA